MKSRRKHSRLASRAKLFKNPPKTLFDDSGNDYEAPAKGPLFPRRVVYALIGTLGLSAMLTLDWFGLLLFNAPGVFQQLGALNALRVTAALMSGICVPSALLMHHYQWVYSYTSDENVFFAITFSISFMLGLPCVLAWIFA
jgi:hypothetical protein